MSRGVAASIPKRKNSPKILELKKGIVIMFPHEPPPRRIH